MPEPHAMGSSSVCRTSFGRAILQGTGYVYRENHVEYQLWNAHEPFGDVYISAPGWMTILLYYRELSLDSARCLTRWTAYGVTYQREVITSFPIM